MQRQGRRPRQGAGGGVASSDGGGEQGGAHSPWLCSF